MGKDYIFCFPGRDNMFWGFDKNDSNKIKLLPDPYFFEFSPDGWYDIAVQNIRNREYWGIDRSITIPFTYLKDAGLILKHVVYTFGFNEPIYLAVLSQEVDLDMDLLTYGYWYKMFFKGRVNSPDFKHNSSKVKCTTLEDGLPLWFKSGDKTFHEFSLNIPESILVKMDGIRLHEKFNFNDTPDFEISKSSDESWLGPLVNTDHEGDSFGVTALSEPFMNIQGKTFKEIYETGNFIFKNDFTLPVTIKIKGVLEFICTNMTSAPAYSLLTQFFCITPTFSPTTYNVYTSPGMVAGTTYKKDFDIDIVVQPGDAIFRDTEFIIGVGAEAKIKYTENSLFNITLLTRRPTTYTRHLFAQDLFAKLINKITSGNYIAAVSPYFITNKNIVFTSGNGIRNFEDATIKTNVSDFFKFWNSYDSVGLIDQLTSVGFDRKRNLVDRENVYDLPQPEFDSINIEPLRELLHNDVIVGYPEIRSDIGALNGNEEFNTQLLFSRGVTLAPGKIDFVSPYKASCYEQEKIRTTILNKDTTDYKSDNDVFVNYIDLTLQPAVDDIPAHYLLDRSLNPTITGLLEPETVWNVRLSPKRMLQNNYDYLRSCTYKDESQTYKNTWSDKNNKMTADGLVERADVNIAAMTNGFFYPWLITANFSVVNNILEVLRLNPLQIFRFTINQIQYTGILNKVVISHGNRRTQTCEFISTTENDLTQLIEFYG
jgi:hypothetical protein